MKQLILQHPVIAALAGYYLLSSAVSSMPSPVATSPAFYRWAFNFLHLLAGNIGRVVARTSYPVAQGFEPNGQSKSQ